jgi:hypothetical protein
MSRFTFIRSARCLWLLIPVLLANCTAGVPTSVGSPAPALVGPPASSRLEAGPPAPSSESTLLSPVASPSLSPSASPSLPASIPPVIYSGGGGGSYYPPPPPTPSPSATDVAKPTPTPSASSVATPTPTPSATATKAPTPSPTPTATPAANAYSAGGQILVNGVATAGIAIWLNSQATYHLQSLSTDAQGRFSATGLPEGDYYALFYNDSDHYKIGYWRSVTLHVGATGGAAWPAVDLYQDAWQKYVPAMSAHVSLPTTFMWVPQAQAVTLYHFEVHDAPGTSFNKIYESGDIPGNATSFTWDGSGLPPGVTLDPNHRYFWGLFWDAGPLGQGGNLYQPVYFNQH